MHYFIKILFITLLCTSICACSRADKRFETEDLVYETDTYKINAQSLIFFKDENLLLNSDIKSECDDWISDFKTRVSDNKIPGHEPPCMRINHKVYKINDALISTVCEKYVYISGVHGQTFWKMRNFDLKNNTFLKLSDLFYDDEYKKVLNTKMSQMLTEYPEKYHDLWEIPKIKNGTDDNFYITDKNLVIFFQPYELSFYAKGVVEFPIEATELRGYIKEEYLNMLS